MSARVEALWLKPEEFGPMQSVETLRLVRRTGIENNADWGGKRQVTILERERWEAMMAELGYPAVDPSARRANVMVSGCDLSGSTHRVLRLGAVRIEIRGETRPCDRMDQAHPGLRRVMASPWNGGAYGVVLDDGAITVGDPVELLESAQPSGRRGRGPEAQARKGYDEGSRPSEQGDDSSSPERVAESDRMQGEESRASSPRTETARGEDEATVHEK